MPQASFEGRVVVVDSHEGLVAACQELSRHSVIGFDTETRPSFKVGVSYNVSLIQLSTPDVCYLVRLNHVRMERELLRLLESTATLKVGVDVVGDIRNLLKIRHFRAGGFVELQQEVVAHGIEDKSLRKMAAIILGCSVSKAQRLSNWEAKELTSAQMRYAATDAWICLRMYEQLGLDAPHATELAAEPAEPKPQPESKPQPKDKRRVYRRRRVKRDGKQSKNIP